MRRPWRPPRSGARVRLQARTKLSGHTRLESLTLSLTTSCSQPASRMCVCPCGARDSLVNSSALHIKISEHGDRHSVKLCQSMRREKCTKIEVGTSIMLIGLDTLQMRSWRRRCGPRNSASSQQWMRPPPKLGNCRQLQLPPNVDRGDLTIYPPWYHV